MWSNFWIQNIHFVIEIFVAFIMLTSAWIFLDSWAIKKEKKVFVRSLGFLTMMTWAFLDAASVSFEKINFISHWIGTAGFLLILISLFLDYIPITPSGIKTKNKLFTIIIGVTALPIIGNWNYIQTTFIEKFSSISQIILPFLKEPAVWQSIFAIIIAYRLYLHFTKGLQFEWKFLFWGFFFLAVSSISTILFIWKNSDNVLISQMLQDYHSIWIFEHSIKLFGAILLGSWTWKFIRFRMFPQLFISFIALSFLIFIFTAIVYTSLLIKNIQDDAITSLKINAKTLDVAFREIKNEAILAAKIAAEKNSVREAIRKEDKESLFNVLNNQMFENEMDFMMAVNNGGQVLMRAEDKDHFGDSLANDPVVWRALDGKSVVTAFVEQNITIPKITIRAASPIIDTSEEGIPEIIGATITGFIIDSAFVDGIKNLTELDVTIFANDVRAATTFSLDETRLLGTRENDQKILSKVLKNSETFSDSVTILNQPFYAVYSPIKDIEDTTIGMIFAGRSQLSIIKTTSNTMRSTFSITVILMMIVIIPIYLLTRFITIQQKV